MSTDGRFGTPKLIYPFFLKKKAGIIMVLSCNTLAHDIAFLLMHVNCTCICVTHKLVIPVL